MKYSDIRFDRNDYVIGNDSMANMFSVEDDGGRLTFNSNKTVVVNGHENASSDMYDVAYVNDGDTWAMLSHRAYGTVDLWWVICKFNGVSDPTTAMKQGLMVKIPKREIVDIIVSSVRSSGRR